MCLILRHKLGCLTQQCSAVIKTNIYGVPYIVSTISGRVFSPSVHLFCLLLCWKRRWCYNKNVEEGIISHVNIVMYWNHIALICYCVFFYDTYTQQLQEKEKGKFGDRSKCALFLYEYKRCAMEWLFLEM